MKSKFGQKLAVVVAALYSGVATAAYQLNFTRGATRLTEDIYDLHNLMMWIITVIFCAVFAVMFYSVYAHRKSVGHKAAQFHEHLGVELAWTIVPFFILIAMAIPATKTLLEIRDSSNPDLTIKATGYQWKWGYDYLKGEGEGVAFLANLSTPYEQIYGAEAKGEHYLLETDRHVVVPVGKKVRILTTAADVIHAWYVPDLGVKQDAVPGFVRDTWFRAEREGVFRGQCAELCGKDHGFMPIVVEVVSAEKYTAWVAETKKAMAAAADDPDKKWELAESKSRGEKVYAANCVACHMANGQGLKGTFPALDGSKIVKGAKRAQIDLVLNGKPNTSMAAFGKQLSDTDIATAITYTRNHWGNSTGEVVQPSEIKAARK
ncbi:MAG: cytochrome c oxidase subunit II [Burkholderiales bacterium]